MVLPKGRIVKAGRCRMRIIHPEKIEAARRQSASSRDLARLSQMFKLLGDPTRLKILMALLAVEMCVCDLAALLAISESAVSHQLRRLKDRMLVKSRRQGQVLYYSLNDDHVTDLIRVGFEHVRE
jgi:DNA-binding transcriptional ArsR family regulator